MGIGQTKHIIGFIKSGSWYIKDKVHSLGTIPIIVHNDTEQIAACPDSQLQILHMVKIVCNSHYTNIMFYVREFVKCCSICCMEALNI